MSDLVTCGECGTRYDSDQNAFCPRCGSTARSKVLPAAVAVARRHDPGRRRVQASGALLLIVGALFLASAIAGLALSRGEMPPEFAELMQDQDGGTLAFTAPDGTTYGVVVAALDGTELARHENQTAPLEVPLGSRAAVRVAITVAAAAADPPRSAGDAPAGNATRATNVTAVAMSGDVLEVDVTEVQDGDVLVSPTLRTVNRVAAWLAVGFTLALLGGGLAAVTLRWWPLAAAAAGLAALLGLVAMAVFLLAGLLFAIPFGFAAAFILRGRRHFRRAGRDA